MSRVILICTEDDSKLKIKFHQYIDNEGKICEGVYNNTFNCRFPKNILVKGQLCEIPADDITLSNANVKPIYTIKGNRVKVVDNTYDSNKNNTVAPVTNCYLCTTAKANLAFAPCGHLCTCTNCFGFDKIKKCPLCKSDIKNWSQPI